MEAKPRSQAGPIDRERLETADGEDSGGRESAHAQLIDEILDAGHQFEFFRLVHILERAFPGRAAPGDSFDYHAEKIRFRPDTSLVFPPSDIKRVEKSGPPDDLVTVVVRFFGLYGFDSPLPAYFYTELARETKDTWPLRDFLDIFNHRLYSFFYRAWKKYRPGLRVRMDGRDEESRHLLSISGIGTSGSLDDTPVPALRLASFAGLLANRVRNADGLRRLIEGCMPGYRAQVVQNVPRWVLIASRPTVGPTTEGERITLGGNSMVGERAFDTSGKFRVVLGPLGLEEFEACLPGGPGARKLDYVVRMYAPDFLDYDVVLRLATSEVPKPVLGDGLRKLGLNLWLGRPAGETTERTIKYGPGKQAA